MDFKRKNYLIIFDTTSTELAYWHEKIIREIKNVKNERFIFLDQSFEMKKKEIQKLNAIYENLNLSRKIAKELSNGKAVGWFQGRMEFGPRALGGRSILADPRSDKMQKN